MPCGTDRSDPVQMLKITPVFPGAMTVKELIRLARIDDRHETCDNLADLLATCSGESRTVFMRHDLPSCLSDGV